jgi:hypothetical protein
MFRRGRIAALLLALALAACAAPRRDVFIPPYAEKGCWARLYEQPGFAGPMRQLEGPAFVESLAPDTVAVPDVGEIPPQPLFTQMQSLLLGPHARIIGYGEPLFRAPSVELAPGARVAELSSLAFHERVRSFTMKCEA